MGTRTHCPLPGPLEFGERRRGSLAAYPQLLATLRLGAARQGRTVVGSCRHNRLSVLPCSSLRSYDGASQAILSPEALSNKCRAESAKSTPIGSPSGWLNVLSAFTMIVPPSARQRV